MTDLEKKAAEKARELADKHINGSWKFKDYLTEGIASAIVEFAREQVGESEKEWNAVRSCSDCRAEAYEQAAKLLVTFEGDCVTDGELLMLRAGTASIRALARKACK